MNHPALLPSVQIFRLAAIGLAVLVLFAAPIHAEDAAPDESVIDAQNAALDRFWGINALETEIAATLNSGALRLGSIGAALLDLEPDNIAAHLALQRYYERVEEFDAGEVHKQEAERLLTALFETGDGSAANPWRASSLPVARLALRARGHEILGQVFTSDAARPLIMALAVRMAGAAHTEHSQSYIDLEPMLERLAARGADEANPGILITRLASEGDTAAHATIGRSLLSHDSREQEQALGHLGAAAERGNLLADLFLAETHLQAATNLGPIDAEFHLDQSVLHYSRAVEAGSIEAMLALASLYLEGRFGEQKMSAGVDLLDQAVDAESQVAMRILAGVWLRGDGHLEPDVERAAELLYMAGELGNRNAQVSLGRLATMENEFEIDRRAVRWLSDLADEDDAEAMVVLANLYGGGHYGRVRTNRARKLYEQASDLSEAPETINEIAWTFAVSHRPALRNPERAVDLMEQLMAANPAARQIPAYLDTWAAAHAAAGDFKTAVRIQRDAIASAEARNEVQVLEELQHHLELFEAGETVSEELP